jgi:hypothetical protein
MRFLVTALLLVLAGSPALANITASTTVPQALSGTLTLVDLTSATLGPTSIPDNTFYSVTFSPGTDPDTGVVQGSKSGKYAPPVINSAGTQYAGKYFSTGTVGSSISIHFDTAQSALAFLWGSIDLVNGITVSFDNGAATYTGSQAAAAAGTVANGFQGFQGSAYVAITPNTVGGKFNDVTFTSTQYSFEFADVRATTGQFDISTNVPDGGTTALLLGFAISALGLVSRRLR